jgi:hypothetical protein
MTAIDIHDDDIRALRDEAREHGDFRQKILCEIALGPDAGAFTSGDEFWSREEARAECVRVIREARANR